jgi:ATP-dependent 26S proteasome regulatory subunit
VNSFIGGIFLPEDVKPNENDYQSDSYLQNSEQQKYFLGQIQKLDKERRRLRMQIQLLTEQRDKLQNSIDRMRQPPLITATITTLLEDGRAVVKSSTGPQFVVQISPLYEGWNWMKLQILPILILED